MHTQSLEENYYRKIQLNLFKFFPAPTLKEAINSWTYWKLYSLSLMIWSLGYVFKFNLNESWDDGGGGCGADAKITNNQRRLETFYW